jgi:UDP-glucose 4-epimerase|tara:strand:- start:4753 stop:5754 length:1002 start_codon:yes stop_codon:yes gene_type:complete
MMNILVTGGAGYIGGHAVLSLQDSGFNPIVFDNFSTYKPDKLPFCECIQGDVRDTRDLTRAFKRYRPVAVMHFAAKSIVSQSILNPLDYYSNNVYGTTQLLTVMKQFNCLNMVFSSTCAVYGEQHGCKLDENTPLSPMNPYASSKMMVERIISDASFEFDLNYVIFRYFNAAGADPSGRFGEMHDPETHVIPILLDVAAGRKKEFTVFGNDFPTKDGTAVRDYLHVQDIAAAHVKAVRRLQTSRMSETINLGTGIGVSVKQLIDIVQDVAVEKLKVVLGPRRAGDASELVSASELAMQKLDWHPERSDVATIVSDAWNWYRSYHLRHGESEGF